MKTTFIVVIFIATIKMPMAIAMGNARAIINFHGAIVENTCTFSHEFTQVHATCEPSHDIHAIVWDMAHQDEISQASKTYIISSSWVDKTETKAILTISYN